MIGVVRAPHSIEVQLLQEADILQHPLLCQGFSPPLIVFMSADTLDEDRLIVVQQLLPLYLIPLEAYLYGHLGYCLFL